MPTFTCEQHPECLPTNRGSDLEHVTSKVSRLDETERAHGSHGGEHLRHLFLSQIIEEVAHR